MICMKLQFGHSASLEIMNKYILLHDNPSLASKIIFYPGQKPWTIVYRPFFTAIHTITPYVPYVLEGVMKLKFVQAVPFELAF